MKKQLLTAEEKELVKILDKLSITNYMRVVRLMSFYAKASEEEVTLFNTATGINDRPFDEKMIKDIDDFLSEYAKTRGAKA